MRAAGTLPPGRISCYPLPDFIINRFREERDESDDLKRDVGKAAAVEGG
jgi:hypothetical protein